MPSPDQIKPFILHDDPDVRELATTYFSDAWSDDPEVFPLVLDASERFGFLENHRCLYHARRLAISEASVDRLLAYLEKAEVGRDVPILDELIVAAPAEVQKSRLAAIDGNVRLTPGTLRRVRRRVEYLDWSAEALWDELVAFCLRSDQSEDHGDVDQPYGFDLTDALSRHDFPDAETVCRLIGVPGNPEGWLQLYAIDLAARRRLREAVPILVAMLKVDHDAILEDSSEALSRIGDVEAARLIRRELPDAPDYFAIYAFSPLGKIRHPEAEQVLVDFLETVEDEPDRVWCLSALCDQLSDRCLDLFRRELERGTAGVEHELAATILAVATILGQELPPEAEAWARDRDAQRARTAYFEGLDPGPYLEPFDLPVPPPPLIPVTIRKTGPAVGRNDPCPCGSGKKFKKCCGRPA